MVFNTKEFQYLKPKNTSYLQKFNIDTTRNSLASTPALHSPKRKNKRKNKSLWNILWPYFKEYCNISSLHCFHYFTNNKFKRYEKLIWLLIIVSTSVSCIFVYLDLAELYFSERLQTTVADSVHPIFVLPFPSIAICLRHRIDWPRLHSSAAKRFLPPDADNETLHAFYKFFESMADIKLYTLHRLASLFNGTAQVNVSLIDNVDITTVMRYLTIPCSQIFSTWCTWRFKSYNCCELFTVERTEFGFCYVFNSAISQKAQEKAKNNKFYPYHNSYAGESSGLELEVLLDDNKLRPGSNIVNGLFIMIKQPEQWHSDVKFVNYNTFTKLAITAQLTEMDNRSRLITPDARGCIFDDETSHPLYKKLPGLMYWRGNCVTRCHQEYVLKYCKCNLNLLFPEYKSDNITSCKPSDFKCIYEHANIFSQEKYALESQYIDDVGNDSMTCNCLNSCNQLLYHAFYSSFPLEGINAIDPIKKVHLDIHFQTAYFLKYRTSLRYTFVELLANFGGIIGLFLGASLLSAIELVFYFTIGLCTRLHSELKGKYCKKSPNAYKRNAKLKIVKISAVKPKNIYKY